MHTNWLELCQDQYHAQVASSIFCLLQKIQFIWFSLVCLKNYNLQLHSIAAIGLGLWAWRWNSLMVIPYHISATWALTPSFSCFSTLMTIMLLKELTTVRSIVIEQLYGLTDFTPPDSRHISTVPALKFSEVPLLWTRLHNTTYNPATSSLVATNFLLVKKVKKHEC